MILDERTYSLKPGLMEDYLRRHRAEALPIMQRYLGKPYGYFVTETDDLNQFVHFWRYESMARPRGAPGRHVCRSGLESITAVASAGKARSFISTIASCARSR